MGKDIEMQPSGNNNNAASSGNRKAPLLPTTSLSPKKNCGACGRLVLLLLPILSASLILSGLYLLAYGNENGSISDTTVSMCLCEYGSKALVILLIFAGATLSFVVTAMRNVQINVYHRRQKSESKFLWGLNLVAAIANVVAYAGFILLVLFDVEGAGDASHDIHMIGAVLFFVLNGVYGLLHSFLLFRQTHYPMYCKLIFVIVPAAMIACSVVFGMDREGRTEFEWYAIAIAAGMIGLVSMLFVVDPADDELGDFFCCRRR